MADKTINDLTSAAPLAGTETLPVWQSGATKKITAQDIANLAPAAPTLNLAYANTYYVAKHGNDTTGDGTIAKPFLTISKAALAIGAATNSTELNDPTQRFYRVIVGSGVYTESVTFGSRPLIDLDLSNALIIGDVKQQYDQGGTFGGTFNATKLNIHGNDLRGLHSATTNPRCGIQGNVILETIGTGSSLFMLCSLINIGVSGDLKSQNGGGGVTTAQFFLSNCNVLGKVIAGAGAGQITLYASQSDTSSSSALGGVTGNVNLHVLRNIRFTGAVVTSTVVANEIWSNVRFASGAGNNFTGATASIRADANSFASYFNNVETKGSETFTLIDEARGVKASASVSNYSAAADNVREHLLGIDTALGLRARRVAVPATASSAGQTGDYAVDASFAYFCIAANTWVRQAVSTF